ncbi:acyltransferase family protein [Asticcacaulis solisilvae]|uniref:acyltransferase family protein n=1 Tax=Asticcacaulis solisilvae TaxID=1217274 RepID=UPI003FD7FB8A
MSKQVNVPLQGLRGIAALLVVIDHSILRFCDHAPAYKWLVPFAGDMGAFGVQVFFAISGYIMVATTWERFAQPRSPGKFAEARIKRIVPTYYIATLIALPVLIFLAGQSFTPANFVRTFLFLPDPSSKGGDSMNPILQVGWSLNCEMFFYVIFTIGLFFRRWLGLTITFGGVLAVFLAGMVCEKVMGERAPQELLFYAQRVMLMFPLGMALAVAERKKWLPEAAQHVPSEVVMILGLLLVVIFNVIMPNKYPIWRAGISFLVSAGAVLSCINAKRPAWLMKWELFLDGVGDRSYSIYLFHLIALTVAVSAFRGVFGDGSLWQIPVTGLIAGVIGYWSYSLFEAPIRKVLASKPVKSKPLKAVAE